jgi:two-component system sensor histidine kinase EvgS
MLLAAWALLPLAGQGDQAPSASNGPRLVGVTNIPKLAVSLSDEDHAWLARRGVIGIGVVANDYVPFDLIGLDNEYEGVSADYLGAVTMALGVPTRVEVFGKREDALKALREGRVDILPTIRANSVDKHLALSQPYVALRPVEVTSSDRRVVRTGPITVGYIEGHVSPQELRRAYPQAQLVTQSSAFIGVAAMSANKLDVFVDLSTTVSYLIDHYQLTNLRLATFADAEPDAMHFAFRADDSALARLVNRALKALPERMHDDVRMRWSPTAEADALLERVNFSEAERRWMAANPVVRWAPVKDFMPFMFVDHRGRYAGLSLQVMDKIESETGLRFEPVEAGDDMAADILPAVTRDQRLPAGMQLSEPVFRDHWVIVCRIGDPDLKQLSNLSGHRIAYFAPNAVVERIKQAVPGVTLVPTDSVAESYEFVAAGRADVTVGNIDSVNYIVRQFFPQRLKVAGSVDDAPVDIGFAVRSDRPELLAIINKTLNSIPPEELRRVRANGMFFSRPSADWAGYVRWLSIGGGTLLLCLAVFALWNRSLKKEVTRRLAVEAELRDQLHFQRAMLEGMPHAVAVRDAQARLMYCNAAYERLFGVARQALSGKTLLESSPDKGNELVARGVHERYLRLLADGRVINEDIDLNVAGQSLRILHWAAPISLRPGGERVAFVSGAIDMTERHHLVELIESARAKSEAANRAKSNFLATMSHEIRTPMNAVMGVLELLVREGRLTPADLESAELARGSARSLLSLIDDILDISKIEAGGLEVVPRPAQLAPIVHDVANVFQSLARQRGLAISVHIDERLASWHAVDAARFKQIVNNLVSNAIKYTDKGGVTIELSSQGVSNEVESVLLEVRDSGIGIAPEDVNNLFKPFFQAEAAGPRTIGGTGLGLPIVQRLCMRMGGDISVTSQRGVGTSICVALHLLVLPAPEADEASDEEPSTPVVPQAERGRFQILVVDDHPANRLLLQRQLDFLGYRSAVAPDGQEALALWRDGHFDAVITDCSMPVMDGYALTAEIRAIERAQQLPHCPVLGYTAHVQEHERRKALDVGMDECLMKPLSVDGLLEALHRHLPDHAVAAPDSSAAPAPPPPQGAAFDPASLKDFSGGDAKIEASFLEAMLRTNMSDLEELCSLMRSGARGELASCAHKIKGAARIVRAGRVVRDCEALEAASHAGGDDAVASAVAALQRSLGEFNEAMLRQLQVDAPLAH